MDRKNDYIIEIYHNGVVIKLPIIGKDRYAQEKAFLAKLLDLHFGPSLLPRPTPDPEYDFYYLTDDQYEKYMQFRKTLTLRHQGK